MLWPSPSMLQHLCFMSLLKDVTTQSVMGFDPLPPLDTIYSYVRPERYLPLLCCHACTDPGQDFGVRWVCCLAHQEEGGRHGHSEGHPSV
jgi:hypothetical protein